MSNLSNRTVLQHRSHCSPAIEKTQFMIDQRKHTCGLGLFNHSRRFFGIHGHWLFTKHCFPMFERSEGDVHVSCWRSDNTDEVNVSMRYEFLPVVTDIRDAELFSNGLGAFAMATRDCDNPRAHAIPKPWNLRRAGEAGSDDSNPNW